MPVVMQRQVRHHGWWKTAFTTAASARTSSEDVYKVWQELSPISEKVAIAIASRRVRGGQREVAASVVGFFQKFASEEVGHENPLFFSSTTDRVPRSAAWRLFSALAS